MDVVIVCTIFSDSRDVASGMPEVIVDRMRILHASTMYWYLLQVFILMALV